MHAELKLFIYTFSFTLSTKMVQLQLHQNNNNNNQIEMEMPVDKEKRPKFCINDHMDVLVEILKRLDGRSLGVAASVCRLWCGIARNDALWEHLCFRHVSPPPAGVRPVVVALGGYRRLYMVCVRPVLSRLRRPRRLIGGGGAAAEAVRKVWSRQEVELSLSLFCVDYYEKLLSGGGKVGSDAPASSLMFLCKAVNV